jgi:hypothetical protein
MIVISSPQNDNIVWIEKISEGSRTTTVVYALIDKYDSIDITRETYGGSQGSNAPIMRDIINIVVNSSVSYKITFKPSFISDGYLKSILRDGKIDKVLENEGAKS